MRKVMHPRHVIWAHQKSSKVPLPIACAVLVGTSQDQRGILRHDIGVSHYNVVVSRERIADRLSGSLHAALSLLHNRSHFQSQPSYFFLFPDFLARHAFYLCVSSIVDVLEWLSIMLVAGPVLELWTLIVRQSPITASSTSPSTGRSPSWPTARPIGKLFSVDS